MGYGKNIHTKATIVKAQSDTDNKYHTRKLILDRDGDGVRWMEKSASFRLGIASCFLFAKPASEGMGHRKFLGKCERNNNGSDVIGRRLSTLVPGT